MRFTRLSLDRLGLGSVAVLQICLSSCSGGNPVAPQIVPNQGVSPPAPAAGAGSVSAQNDAPTLVLRTTPPVDPERGYISGPRPLTVLFNLCRSTDPDEADRLNYQFNFGEGRPAFNPDGTFNADFDHFCRTEYTYRSAGTFTATVSVTDKHLDDQGRDVVALARRTETVTIVVLPAPRSTLTVVKAGTGTGTVTGSGINCGDTCSANILPGTEVSLSAVADVNSVFIGWSLESCGSSVACAFTLAGTTTVTAVFDLQPGAPSPPPPPSPPPTSLRLEVAKAGEGSGTVTGNGISCGATCAVNLPAGTAVSLTAVADPGSDFTGWGPPCGSNASCSFTMTGNTTVTAGFELQRGTLVILNDAPPPNGPAGVVWDLVGVVITGPQPHGPLPGIAAGQSLMLPSTLAGAYSTAEGRYYPVFVCPAWPFTVHASATTRVHYNISLSAGQGCLVTAQ